MFRKIKYDIQSIRERDPAAAKISKWSVFWQYKGLHAILYHGLANFFYRHKWKYLARWISNVAKRRTGVEIHPAAQLGPGLFIDHGVGVVIGETAIVGKDCTIYQGVTLGGTGKETGKRHPTIGNNVMIGAGAKVLGGITVGDNCKIAANAVVLHDIPENCTAVGVPAQVVRRCGERVQEADMDQVHIPDPIMAELNCMHRRIEELEQRLAASESGDRKPKA